MLSAQQIFRDSKENDLASVIKDRKLSSTDKPKNLGLKLSTNISHGKSSSSDSAEIIKKPHSKSVKSCEEVKLKAGECGIERDKKSEDQEEWPEVENMFIYDEPEDDYDDIIPKCERFTKEEINFFFRTSYIGRFDDESENEDLPTFTLDDLTDFYAPPSPVSEEFCIDIPLEIIPIPSPPKYWN